jgi:hypothetical protein
MVCSDCVKQKHALCRGDSWCDCAHRGDCQLCCGLQTRLIVHKSQKHSRMTGQQYRDLVSATPGPALTYYQLPEAPQ